MKTKVIKVGGSCLTTADDIKKILPILNEGEDFVLVVSAFKNVTNLIESWYDSKDVFVLQRLENKIREFFNKLFPDKNFDNDFSIFNEIKDVHKNNVSRNYAQALGEKISSLIIKMYLLGLGVDIEMAKNDPLIYGDNNGFDLEGSIKNILDFYNNKKSKHVLTQGFASIDENGKLNNLCREGSDLTAIIWAHALNTECILYKDVGAIYTSDPNKGGNAKIIPEISFTEYKDKFYKSKVIQDRVVDFCIQHNIPLSIFSYINNTCGTKIYH